MLYCTPRLLNSIVVTLAYSSVIFWGFISILPVSARAAQVKGWSAETEVGGTACLLTYSTDSVSLHFYRDAYSTDAYIDVPKADLPYEFKFNWSPDTGPDRRLNAALYEDDELYRVNGHPNIAIDDLLLELEPASLLTLGFTKGVVRTVTLQTYPKAFADYRKCAARFDNKLAAQSDNTSEQQPDDQIEDEPIDRADTLETMPTKVIGEFLCEVSGSDLLGVPDISGNDRSRSVTLSVFGDGSATYNGRRLVLEANKKAADGTYEFVTYDVRQIIKATGPDPNAPPIAGLDAQGMNEYSAFLGAGNAMMQMVLGNRSRLLFVSLTDGRVIFLDHQNGDKISNQSAPQCIRTQ